MRLHHATILTVVIVIVAGCTSPRRSGGDTSPRTPVEIELGDPGGPARGPVTLPSGQMFVPPRCCPPLELRNAKGDVVQEFDVTAWEQRLVAPAGAYLLVGHDPAGEECVAQIQVTDN